MSKSKGRKVNKRGIQSIDGRAKIKMKIEVETRKKEKKTKIKTSLKNKRTHAAVPGSAPAQVPATKAPVLTSVSAPSA